MRQRVFVTACLSLAACSVALALVAANSGSLRAASGRKDGFRALTAFTGPNAELLAETALAAPPRHFEIAFDVFDAGATNAVEPVVTLPFRLGEVNTIDAAGLAPALLDPTPIASWSSLVTSGTGDARSEAHSSATVDARRAYHTLGPVQPL